MYHQGTPPGATSQAGKMVEQLLGWPSPEKFLFEIQRLNTNLEVLQPDIHKLANAIEVLRGPEIQNLTAALNKVKVEEIIRVLSESNRLVSQVTEGLWGKK